VVLGQERRCGKEKDENQDVENPEAKRATMFHRGNFDVKIQKFEKKTVFSKRHQE